MARRHALPLAVAALALWCGTASAQPHPWRGHGLYTFLQSLDCMEAERGAPWYHLQSLGAAAVVGQRVAGSGDIQGTVRGKGGRVLAGRITDSRCGEGRFKLVMDGSLQGFTGKIRFPGERGPVNGIYLADPADRYDVRLSLRFSAAKKGSIAPGKNAVLVAIIENAGPDTIPLASLLLRLRFSAPVGVKQVALVKKLAAFEFGVDLDPATPQDLLEIPIAVGEVLILAVKLVVPDALAGTTLGVDGDFVAAPLSLGTPFVPPATAHAEIAVSDGGKAPPCEKLDPFYGGGFVRLSVDGGPTVELIPTPDVIIKPSTRVISIGSDIREPELVFFDLFGSEARKGTHPVRPDPDVSGEDKQLRDYATGVYQAASGDRDENHFDMFDGTVTIDAFSGGRRHELRGSFDVLARNAVGTVVHLTGTYRHCQFTIERAGRDDSAG